MDRASFQLDMDLNDDLHLDVGDGGEEPPLDTRTGGGGRGSGGTGKGRAYRVWPWILGIVAVLAFERFALQSLLQSLDASGLMVAGALLVMGVAVAIAAGGLWIARLRR